jgi:hypothetical protein
MPQAPYGIKPVKSTNNYGRSNRRHFARANIHKKTSPYYEIKRKGVQISKHTGDGQILCPSGYTRGQGWAALHKAWIGYRIASSGRNGEGLSDRLGWAIKIQEIQEDLLLPRSSFPQLSLIGDKLFLYDLQKQSELEDIENERELKRIKRAHIREIIDAGRMTDKEVELMREEFGPALQMDAQNRYVERIVMPNFFDGVRRNPLVQSNPI